MGSSNKTRSDLANTVDRIAIGMRVLEARTGMGLSQQAFADLMKTSRVSIVKYESGKGLPSAEILVAFAMEGLDVRYILIGNRDGDKKTTRDRFRRAFEEVERQAKTNREKLSDAERLDLAWRIYDAFSISDTMSQKITA